LGEKREEGKEGKQFRRAGCGKLVENFFLHVRGAGVIFGVSEVCSTIFMSFAMLRHWYFVTRVYLDFSHSDACAEVVEQCIDACKKPQTFISSLPPTPEEIQQYQAKAEEFVLGAIRQLANSKKGVETVRVFTHRIEIEEPEGTLWTL
jgi:hypothetical protein